MLLTRDQFRNQVFSRDKNQCVICGKFAKDAHHIIERRLFPDGGYYLNNGASLCEQHHIEAEATILSCDDIRKAAHITHIILPPHLYRDNSYDKWGNLILPNGTRCKGELFFDESVQKILSNIIHIFTDYVKYPRTYHLPWSEGATKDDYFLEDLSIFVGRRVIVTEKMDGENSSFYSDYYHARSLESDNHWSKTYAKNFHASIAHNIPSGWRICAENLYARHSIAYDNLVGYIQAFSIWDAKNTCIDWDATVEWCELIGVGMVPLLYDGIYNASLIRSLFRDSAAMEGYVIRIADSFTYGQFSKCVGKFVRANHVQTSHHWKEQCLINGIKKL